MTSQPASSSTRLRTALLLAAIFLTGGAAGAGVMRALPGPHPEGGGPPPFPYREVGLTPAQEAQVREILARNKPRMDQLLEEMVPRVRTLAEDVESQIVTVLTPEQKQRFTEFKAGRPPPLPLWARPPPSRDAP